MIATARAIEDAVAREFAVAFYTELAAGTIPAAFKRRGGACGPHRGRAAGELLSSQQPRPRHRGRMAEPADERGSPWELRLRAGAELAAAEPARRGRQPIFGLPPLPEGDLPDDPFRGLRQSCQELFTSRRWRVVRHS